METIWCLLCDPHHRLVQKHDEPLSMDFGPRTNHTKDFSEKLLAIDLNAFQQDQSLFGRILLLVFLLNSFHWEELLNSGMTSEDPTTSGESLSEARTHHTRLSKFEADFKQQQGEMTNKIDMFLKAINDRMTRALPSDTVKNPKLNVNFTSSVLSARSYPIEDPQGSSRPLNSINAIILKSSSPKRVHFINTITILSKEDELGETKIVKQDTKDNDHESIVKVEEKNFMIVEDISSIIDLRLSQVVLGKPFVEVSNMTHDSSIGVEKFTIEDD
ncbi:hypothetical protein Tco_0216302 [Tanacetum coccineum]